MSRFKDAEKLGETVRGEIPSVAINWLGAARKEMEKLTKAALRGDLSDEEFRAMVEATSKRLPSLLDDMDHDALAKLMEDGMGASMANGMGDRQKTARSKPQEKRAKMPWESDVLLGGKGRYDESKRKRDKNGKFASKEGREWKPADAEEAGVLSRLTGLKFKAGTRIHATADGLRHAEKGHGHQLQEKDWSQLRGRLFDPRTEQSVGMSGNREKVIQFNFQRGSDPMEAVFTVHPFKNPGAPGELRLKTYKKLDPRDLAARKKN